MAHAETIVEQLEPMELTVLYLTEEEVQKLHRLLQWRVFEADTVVEHDPANTPIFYDIYDALDQAEEVEAEEEVVYG